MSKIEEMATTAEYNGTSRKVFEDGFIVGANAILREIENVLYSPITPYQQYNDLDKLVKELKSE